MPRIPPLPLTDDPDVQAALENFKQSLGFVPNAALIMQYKPAIAKGFAMLSWAMWGPDSEVDVGFKRLISHVSSSVHGCRYWMAHSAGASLRLGIPEDKFNAVWEYRFSPLFTEAERVAIEFTVAASSQPNDVTDELFARMQQHWTDGQIVEITGVIALFGFLNRWNDTMATPLEKEPAEVGEKHLAKRGWSVGRHKS